jgi:hypothetical protein
MEIWGGYGRLKYDEGLRMCLMCQNYDFCRGLSRYMRTAKFCFERKQVELQACNELEFLVLFLGRYSR